MTRRLPIRTTTPAGRVLAALQPGDLATEEQLAEAAGIRLTSRALSAFRDRTLQRLIDREAITEVAAKRWSLTAVGVVLRADMLGIPRPAAPARAAGEAPSVAAPRTPTVAGTYDGAGLSDAAALRKGAFDFRACPSRMGDWLVYRDGRRVFDPIAPAASHPTVMGRR